VDECRYATGASHRRHYLPIDLLLLIVTVTTLKSRKCPTCGKSHHPSPGSLWLAFCSERCQLIDLGAWADERHAIPGEALDDPLKDSMDLPPESDH